jgi:hypothetical protein
MGEKFAIRTSHFALPTSEFNINLFLSFNKCDHVFSQQRRGKRPKGKKQGRTPNVEPDEVRMSNVEVRMIDVEPDLLAVTSANAALH